MKTLPLLCILAFSLAEGDISPEPNVVLQSVVLGKKPNLVGETDDDCRGGYATYNGMNMAMRRIIHDLYPQSSRYKRNENSYASAEPMDDKTMDKILEALDELKQDTEKNEEQEEDVKERDEDLRKSRLDQVCKRGGKWHKKPEECQSKRRKDDMESYKKMLRENLDEILSENKDLEKKMKKVVLRKKDWKEELERRRLKESLADSWPRMSDERLPEDLYIPMPYHHQPSHHREYPPSGYLP